VGQDCAGHQLVGERADGARAVLDRPPDPLQPPHLVPHDRLDPTDPHHTFYFHIDEGRVIDAKHGGNASRWINHACAPNCEADDDGERVFIKALRNLKPGEELFYDYGLVIDERYTPALKRQYACRCGARDCRGTMLAPKRQKLGG
jgi:hypothetical protein